MAHPSPIGIGVGRDFDELIDRARQACLAQDLTAAARLCEKVLAVQRDHLDALNLLGAIEIQRGRTVPAMDLLARAIDTHPGHFAAHYNLAFLHERLGRPHEAAAGYRRAIERKPDHLDAYLNLGNALQALQRFDEAADAYRRALQLRPDFAEACNNLGNALVQSKRHAEALVQFRRAIALKPDFAAAHSNLADLLQLLRRYEEAVEAYRRALELRPGTAETVNNLGKAMLRLGFDRDALSHFQAAIALKPDYAVAFVNLAYVQQKIERVDEALASCARALELNPDLVEAHCLYAGLLETLDRSDEALVVLDRLIQSRPEHVKALLARGVLMRAAGRYDEALADYQRAIDLDPDDADAKWNLALFHLLHGRYEQGWDLFECRWQSVEYERPRHEFAQRSWSTRSDLHGKTMLLSAEQGLGDSIMFCRFAPMVEALGVRVVLEVSDSLVALMRTLSPSIRVISVGDPSPPTDCCYPLMSLPREFGITLETFSAPRPYLSVDPGRRSLWIERLGPKSGPRIGLAWSGRREHWNDFRRSMPACLLSTLLTHRNLEFHSLHKEVRNADGKVLSQLRSWHDQLTDFADTAALADLMDVVVSVDTSVAHLAGALGKEVWVLLPHAPDYRWMLDRPDSPWYPSARLFRQPRPGDWTSVIERVIEELNRRFGIDYQSSCSPVPVSAAEGSRSAPLPLAGEGQGVRASNSKPRGYALVAALIVLVVASLAVTLAVSRTQLEAQREREAQLLFVGDQYRRAIADYFTHPPLGQATRFPRSFDELLEDHRGTTLRRWLRKLYPDPMTGRADWQIDKIGDRIAGIRSSSNLAPLRRAGFGLMDAAFAEAHSYQDWRFDATGAVVSMAATGQQAVAPAGANPSSSSNGGGASPFGRAGTLNPLKNCQLQYVAPQSQCSQQPPPLGTDYASCVASYQQLLDQCVASIPGN